MARRLRFVPEGALVEITTRTVRGRYLLRPSEELRQITHGILARAAERFDVGVCYSITMSNHMHLLLRPKDAGEMAGFMGYLNGNLAREAGRLHKWKEKFWGRRYKAISVDDEAGAQIGRLRYLLEQGCKEGLIRRPQDWPGPTAIHALLSWKPLRGIWFNRTKEYEARSRGKKPSKYEFSTRHSLLLEPLPCWDGLSKIEIRRHVESLVREIGRETISRLKREGRSPVGIKRLLKVNPHSAPEMPARSPAPRFHALTQESRDRFESTYREFVLAYRRACRKLQSSKKTVVFPMGSFPPGLPFVREDLMAPKAAFPT